MARPLRAAWRAGLAALALTPLACGGVEDEVKAQFSRAHSCPGGRITVTRRPDLTERSLRARAQAKRFEVPPELQNDPRLAGWKKRIEEERARLAEELKPPTERTPPTEVASDPERLALWRKQQKAEEERLAREDADNPVAVADGCGQRVTYVCRYYRKSSTYSCSPTESAP